MSINPLWIPNISSGTGTKITAGKSNFVCSRSGELKLKVEAVHHSVFPQTWCSLWRVSYSHSRDREAAMRKGTNRQSNVPKDVLLKKKHYVAILSFPSVLFFDGQELQVVQPWKLSLTQPQLPLVRETKPPRHTHDPHSTTNSTAFLHACSATISPLLCFVFSKGKDKRSCLSSDQLIHRLHLYRTYPCEHPVVSLTLTQS